VFVRNDETSGEPITEKMSPPGYQQATNQEMEILASTTALRESLRLELPHSIRRLVIWSDSMYACDSYWNAISRWPKAKWLGKYGQPIENAPDWKDLAKWYAKALARFDVVKIQWARKDSTPYSKAAHKLAQESAKNAINKPRKIVHSGRKRSKEKVDRGGVRMEGQDLTVYVTECKPLTVQKLWRATYEVVNSDSPYCGRRDKIITDWRKRLDRGHTYRIRVNKDTRNPRVDEVYGEVMPSGEKEKGEPTADTT